MVDSDSEQELKTHSNYNDHDCLPSRSLSYPVCSISESKQLNKYMHLLRFNVSLRKNKKKKTTH